MLKNKRKSMLSPQNNSLKQGNQSIEQLSQTGKTPEEIQIYLLSGDSDD